MYLDQRKPLTTNRSQNGNHIQTTRITPTKMARLQRLPRWLYRNGGRPRLAG